MSVSNSINQRKNGVNDGISESSEQHLSHVKSSGGMTISPELFEKVIRPAPPFVHSIFIFLSSSRLMKTLVALPYTKNSRDWRPQEALCESNPFGLDVVNAQVYKLGFTRTDHHYSDLSSLL
jgi:hypothetical protein